LLFENFIRIPAGAADFFLAGDASFYKAHTALFMPGDRL
jgi:hypothetical protein